LTNAALDPLLLENELTGFFNRQVTPGEMKRSRYERKQEVPKGDQAASTIYCRNSSDAATRKGRLCPEQYGFGENASCRGMRRFQPS
jgi:hypothetical protein